MWRKCLFDAVQEYERVNVQLFERKTNGDSVKERHTRN